MQQATRPWLDQPAASRPSRSSRSPNSWDSGGPLPTPQPAAEAEAATQIAQLVDRLPCDGVKLAQTVPLLYSPCARLLP